MTPDTPPADGNPPVSKPHRKTPPATPAVRAWLDGEAEKDRLTDPDEQETAELWTRINSDRAASPPADPDSRAAENPELSARSAARRLTRTHGCNRVDHSPGVNGNTCRSCPAGDRRAVWDYIPRPLTST